MSDMKTQREREITRELEQLGRGPKQLDAAGSERFVSLLLELKALRETPSKRLDKTGSTRAPHSVSPCWFNRSMQHH